MFRLSLPLQLQVPPSQSGRNQARSSAYPIPQPHYCSPKQSLRSLSPSNGRALQPRLKPGLVSRPWEQVSCCLRAPEQDQGTYHGLDTQGFVGIISSSQSCIWSNFSCGNWSNVCRAPGYVVHDRNGSRTKHIYQIHHRQVVLDRSDSRGVQKDAVLRLPHGWARRCLRPEPVCGRPGRAFDR